MRSHYRYCQASVVILLLIFVAFLFPVCPSGVQALEDEATTETIEESIDSEEVMTEEYSLMAVNNDIATQASDNTSSVAISIQNAINIDVDPNIDDGFSSSTANITIRTAYTEDYVIFLQTKNGSANLKPRNEHNWASIVPVPQTTTINDFPANTWGYNLRHKDATSELLFSPVPAKQTEVLKQNVANTGTQVDQWELNFGAKLSTIIPADTYTNEVIVTVVASPFVAKGLDSITYMQEMTPQVCATTAEHVSKSLIDRRDNKSYRVTKLRDGNCWMTENLALTSQGMTSVKGDATLTPSDSDVETDWTLPATHTTIDSGNTHNTSATAIQSWNNSNGYGTYYTFNAATAGKGAGVTGSQVNVLNSSVCPKGWKLPIAGSHFNDVSGSFYYLLNKYNATGNNTLIKATPLSFTDGGYVMNYSNGGALYSFGEAGFYRSSTSIDSANAFLLYFSASYTSPSFNIDTYTRSRQSGQSVRCLAR